MIVEQFTRAAGDLNRGKKLLAEGSTLNLDGAHASLAENADGSVQVTLANRAWKSEDLHTVTVPGLLVNEVKIGEGEDRRRIFQVPVGTVAKLGNMGIMTPGQAYSAASSNEYHRIPHPALPSSAEADPSQQLVYLQASDRNTINLTTTPLEQ